MPASACASVAESRCTRKPGDVRRANHECFATPFTSRRSLGHPAEAAAAIVYDMADIFVDPHFAERGVIVDVGGLPQQGLLAKLSATPGRIGWAGRPLGADTNEVLAELLDGDGDGAHASRREGAGDA